MRLDVRRVAIAAVSLIAVALIALASSACGPASGTGTPASSTVPAPVRVTIVRTGGFAGVTQRIDIAPDGSWVYTDKRTSTVERGRLSEAQRQQLARIAADPALAEEARRSLPSGGCADMFVYAVTVGDLLYGYVEGCGTGARQARTEDLLALVSDATPF
jgi:hypothetical protein